MKWLKNLVVKIATKKVADKLNLEEGKMEDGKKWYRSKGVLTGIVTVLIGLYTGVDTQVGPQAGFDLPNIPELVFVVLGALGIYSRVVADKEIK
jgi:hypothetical protein